MFCRNNEIRTAAFACKIIQDMRGIEYMKKTKLLTALLVTAFVLGGGVLVSAAPERMPDGEIFDAEYYAALYPDVVEIFGTDTAALYRHYIQYGMAEHRLASNPDDSEEIAKMREDFKKITISFAGDCTLGGFKGQSSSNTFHQYYDMYGADYFFKNVKDIFEQDDITFVNLEGALTSYPQVVEKKYPIKGEPEYVDILCSGSVEVVNLANNHTFDCGQSGYDACRQLLTDNGIAYCGDSYTCIIEKNGIRTGFVGMNCWGMSKALNQQLETLITGLRNDGCDIVCVMFHGGVEYEYTSNATTEAFAHSAIDHGADIVVGAHPHVVQGIELYNGRVICYSLGNFSFGANKNPSDKDTFIFQQTFFVENDKTVSYGESKVIPCRLSSVDTKNDYCPTPQTGEEGRRILQKLASCSAKYKNTPLSSQGK